MIFVAFRDEMFVWCIARPGQLISLPGLETIMVVIKVVLKSIHTSSSSDNNSSDNSHNSTTVNSSKSD